MIEIITLVMPTLRAAGMEQTINGKIEEKKQILQNVTNVTVKCRNKFMNKINSIHLLYRSI